MLLAWMHFHSLSGAAMELISTKCGLKFYIGLYFRSEVWNKVWDRNNPSSFHGTFWAHSRHSGHSHHDERRVLPQTLCRLLYKWVFNASIDILLHSSRISFHNKLSYYLKQSLKSQAIQSSRHHITATEIAWPSFSYILTETGGAQKRERHSI